MIRHKDIAVTCAATLGRRRYAHFAADLKSFEPLTVLIQFARPPGSTFSSSHRPRAFHQRMLVGRKRHSSTPTVLEPIAAASDDGLTFGLFCHFVAFFANSRLSTNTAHMASDARVLISDPEVTFVSALNC